MKADSRQFYEGYWRYRKEIDHLYRGEVPARLRAVCDMISLGDKTSTRVLDVGCGEGSLGKLLKERWGKKIYTVGLDISDTALEMAGQHYDEIHRTDIERDQWEDDIGLEKFGYIVSVEVLEHLFEPRRTLLRFKNLLETGGSIIVSFPNIAFYRCRLDLLFGHFPSSQHLYHPAEHLHYFSLDSFTDLLASCGLRVVGIGGSFRLPGVLDRLPDPVRRYAFRAFPNLFGHQVVLKTKVVSPEMESGSEKR